MLSLGLGLGLSRQQAAFSPLQLSPELFLDPSDTSTLFQDIAGTTPVTSAGDPVGLVLDKSQGLRRGVELVTNGTFDTDLSGWVDRSTGSGAATWTASGVEIARVDGGNTGHMTQDVTVTPGEWYTFTATLVSGSGAAFRLGSTTASNELYDAILAGGKTTVTVRATTSVISVGLRGALNGTTSVVDDISMRHLPGNHLTAPSDAARPTYQTGGGLHWLEFDGVDDQLEAATRFGFVANPALLVTAGVRPVSYTLADERIWHVGTSGATGTVSGTLGRDGLTWRHNNGNRIFGNVAAGSDYVISHSRQAGDTYGDQLGFVDGVSQAQTDSANPSFTPSNTGAQFYVGSTGGSLYLNMRLYSLTLTGEHTAAQQTQLEHWAARKQGRTL